MAGPVPEEFLETVRSRIDIVEIISEYVVLKKTGRNYAGLCPFHQEKTPSFTVSPTKQIFYCFGCGTGGSIFTFLMKKDHLTFPEAVESLARRVGLELPRTGHDRERHNRKTRYYELNAQVAEFYHRILMSGDAGKQARDYLLRRGVQREVWGTFLLGYAPPGGGELLQFLREKGYDPQFLAEAGLVVSNYGDSQVRFRGRLIYPIFNARGRCLGFGGRALNAEHPKYLNSSESFVFSKSRNLYGLNLALPAIREADRALVVEGYMDCIALHQSGFSNTVAALGTAFTREQARLLLRYTRNVVLAFDTDAAGTAASLRGAGYLQEEGGRVYVLDLPSGKDPDEFLRAGGKEAFAAALQDRTLSYLEFKLEQLMRKHDPTTAYGRVEIIGAILDDLARTENLVLREGFIRQVAGRVNVSEDAIRAELVRYLGRKQEGKDRNDKNRYNMEQNKQVSVNPGVTAPEIARRGLFRFMCLDRGVWELVQQELGCAVFQGKLRRFVDLLVKNGWSNPSEWLDHVDELDQAELASLLLDGDDQEIDQVQQRRMVEDYLRILKKERLHQQIDRQQAVLREFEKNRDLAGIKNSLAELHHLYTELEKLKSTG